MPNSRSKGQRSQKRNAGLDLRREIIAVCARLGLRLGLDDLLTLVHGFLDPTWSKLDLTRCMKRYGVSRLPSLGKPWPAKPSKNAGTHFYYSRMVFPPRFCSKVPLVVDLMVDSACRMVRFQATVPPHGSALAFVKDTVARFPMEIAGIIAESPVFFLNAGTGLTGDTRRHLHMLEQFCTMRGIDCDVVSSVSGDTLKALTDSCGKAVALNNAMGGAFLNGQAGAAKEQPFSDWILAGLDMYHHMPLKGLKGRSPNQAMAVHYQNFPAHFVMNKNQIHETFI